MAKKAFLVTFEVTTRVVVDIDADPETNDDAWNKVLSKACDYAYMNAPEWGENVQKIEEDTECPYNEEYD